MEFKRSLGPFGLMFSAVSGIMGSAWLFGPYFAAKLAGPASLISWVVGAVMMIIIAMTFAELVCLTPVPGGNARFIQFSHGTLTSFIFSWMMWLGYAAVAPVETMGVLQYLSSVYPILVSQKMGVTVLTGEGYIAAAIVLFLMCILNFASIKWLSRWNAVIVWFKVFVPVIVAVCLIYAAFNIHHFHSVGGFMPNGLHGVASAISYGGIIFSFAGYAPAIVLAGEAKNPQKTIPLVLVGALVICLCVYFVLEVAFIGSVQPDMLIHGWSKLHFFGDTSPFVGLAHLYHLDVLKKMIFTMAVLAPLGTALIFIATSSRFAFAMSQNGYFPKIFKNLNKSGVPYIAVSLNFVIGMLLFFPSPGWQGMVGFLVSAFVLCYVIGPVALISLRTIWPEQQRDFKLPFAHVWCFLAFYFSNLIIYWTGWSIFKQMLIAILVGLALLLLSVVISRKSFEGVKFNIKEAIWVFGYLMGMGVITYLGVFSGGNHFLSFGWDAVVIAIFSALILFWARISILKGDDIPEVPDVGGE